MNFINIGLVMVYHTSKIEAAFISLINFLEQNQIKPKIYRSLASLSDSIASLDCIIVVGGDGSMLAVSELAAKQQIPVIGVHHGNLGFLSDIYPDNPEELLDILNGQFQREERTLLEITINGSDQSHIALNEVAINRKAESHIISYELFAGDTLICKQRSDGVLIHTPTGSTAYALSAGGPIIQPLVNTFGIVPLNPHRLNTRPIMLKNNQNITVKLSSADNATISFDGKNLISKKLEFINIVQSRYKLILLHPISYDYFARLRHKLHWEL